MFSKKLLLLLPVLQTLLSYGQTYPYKQFTTNNGLINNRCGNVSQDSAGYIWITSDNGISNYDGRKFTFFPGKRSTYYFAHTNTINLYKGQCVFATSTEGFAVGLANKLSFHTLSDTTPNQPVYGLILNDSTTLTGKTYSKNLELVTGNRKKIIPPPAGIAKKMTSFLMFLKDGEGNIWIGTDAGIYIYNKGNFSDPYILPAAFNKYTNVLKIDFAGNIFFAARQEIYKVFREQLKDIRKTEPVKFATHENEITAMGFFRNGDIMISDLPHGISIYDKQLHVKKKINKHGLPDVVYWDIFVDKEENIWFATENGVYRFSNFNAVNYIPDNVYGAPNIHYGYVYNDRFIFSNNINFYTIENEELKQLKYTHPKDNYSFIFLLTPAKNIWMNLFFNQGVYNKTITRLASVTNDNIIETKTINNSRDSRAVIDIDKVAAFNNSSMAFLTYDKEIMLGQHDKIEQFLLPREFDSIKFNAIAPGFNTNEIIVAANKIGLFYCKVEPLRGKFQLKIMDTILFDSLLKNDRCVKMVITNDKKIWLGTRNNGIRIFSKEKNKYSLYRTLSEPDISSSFITELQKDSAGSIWVGSNKGIDKVSVNAQKNFSINKGLFNNLMNGRYIYFIREHRNKLYIGTTGSLFVTDNNLKFSSTIPTAGISHLIVNNANADSLLTQQHYTFSPSQNNLTFEFVSPTFIDEQATEYQYQLEGIDKDWSTPAGNYTIAYSQLPAGDYTFKVRAKNANSVWSLTNATFSFTIQKPFYKHGLFFLLCGAVVVGVSYWLYRQKMNRLIAVERTRRSISKDLHDDIGTTLSSITLMNAVLKNKITSQPEEAKRMAAKIETTSRDMIQNMSDIVWSINPNNDTMEKLIYRLQQFCNDIFDKPGIQYQLNIDEGIKLKTLNMQLRRDIYLICKEIVNNAAKYSKANSFTLSLSLKQRTIVLDAKDNGTGFTEAALHKGNGLINIRQRVNSHNGEVNLQTGDGTAWCIRIPT